MQNKPGPPKNARQYLVRLLARREYSEAELSAKLKQREVPPEKAADALEFVKKHELQSDERFTASRSRMLARRKGNRAILMDLANKGIDAESANEALTTLDSEYARAKVAASRFEGKLGEERERARLWRFLASRGFSGDTVKRVLREMASGIVDDE